MFQVSWSPLRSRYVGIAWDELSLLTLSINISSLSKLQSIRRISK